MDTLDALCDYLRSGGEVGIFDATNSTRARRKAILERVNANLAGSGKTRGAARVSRAVRFDASSTRIEGRTVSPRPKVSRIHFGSTRPSGCQVQRRLFGNDLRRPLYRFRRQGPGGYL